MNAETVLGFWALAVVCPDQKGRRATRPHQNGPVQILSFRFQVWPGRYRGSGPLFLPAQKTNQFRIFPLEWLCYFKENK